jgi:hypothetical protein
MRLKALAIEKSAKEGRSEYEDNNSVGRESI